jgi:hypothetical protein
MMLCDAEKMGKTQSLRLLMASSTRESSTVVYRSVTPC